MNDQTEQSPDEVLVYEVSASESTSGGVIEAVAAASNVRAVESDDGTGAVLEALFDVVDPDALDALFQGGARGRTRIDGEVTFTYSGHDVRVRSDGTIEVTRPAPEVDEAPSP